MSYDIKMTRVFTVKCLEPDCRWTSGEEFDSEVEAYEEAKKHIKEWNEKEECESNFSHEVAIETRLSVRRFR